MPLLLAPAAHAGSYIQVSQTGGTATGGDGKAYDYVNGGFGPCLGYLAGGYGGRVSGENADLGNGDSGPADCSGGITTTYQWQPDYPGEVPPKQVLVHESCEAGYGSVNPVDEPAGQCDDGFGDPEEDYGTPVYYCRRSRGSHYTVQAGGQTVTVHCSPSATGSPDDFVDEWISWVAYNVSISPIAIDLGGTTHDDSGGDNILIGQGCTATLSAGPATLSNFQWSVPGETFADYRVLDYSYEWDPDSESTFFVPGSGTVYAVDPSEYSKPNPHWYWKKGSLYGEEMTVSCTASASVNGQSIGSVTAEKKVSV